MLTMIRPDDAGRFSFDVPPGAEYEVKAINSTGDLEAVEKVRQLSPGEHLDLYRLDQIRDVLTQI